VGNLQIPIVQIPRKAPLSIDERLEASDDLTNNEVVTTLKYIQVIGEWTSIHTDYLFQGTITGTFKGPCDRCIEPAETDERVYVSWLFEPGKVPDAMEDFAQSEETEDDEDEEFSDLEEESDQIRYYEGDTIDLAPHAREEMVLASPTKIYCTEDCKGLCPQCGVNLNHKTCDCTEEEIEEKNTGFNALKDLYPDLPSNTSEE
jgi:uncharacterized protein